MAVIVFCPPSFVHPAWLAVQEEAPQIPQVDSQPRVLQQHMYMLITE